jgi:hypothetical protein
VALIARFGVGFSAVRAATELSARAMLTLALAASGGGFL